MACCGTPTSGAAFFSNWAISSLLAKRLPLPDGRLPGVAAPPSTRDIKSIGIARVGTDDNFVGASLNETEIAKRICVVRAVPKCFGFTFAFSPLDTR